MKEISYYVYMIKDKNMNEQILNFWNCLTLEKHREIRSFIFKFDEIINEVKDKKNSMLNDFSKKIVDVDKNFFENDYDYLKFKYIVENSIWLFTTTGDVTFGYLFDKYLVGIDTEYREEIKLCSLYNFPFENIYDYQGENLNEKQYLNKIIEDWSATNFVKYYPEYKKICNDFGFTINYNDTKEPSLSREDFEQRIEKAIGIKKPLNFSD